jgi:hypothetical protein
MTASPRLVEALVLILVRRFWLTVNDAPAWMVDWLSWMSVTVLRAASGSGAPRLSSALMCSVPPPSMRHPPATVLAVLMLARLSKMRVPAPSFTIVLVPAMVELMIEVTPASTVKVAAPVMFSVPELTE